MKKSTIVILLFVIIFMITGCGMNKDKPSSSNVNDKQLTEKEKLDLDGSCDFEHKTEPDIKVPAQRTNNIADDKAIQSVLKLVD